MNSTMNSTLRARPSQASRTRRRSCAALALPARSCCTRGVTDREMRLHPAFRFDARPDGPETVWEGYLRVAPKDGTLRFKRARVAGNAFVSVPRG